MGCLMLVPFSVPCSAANGHSECLHMMIDYGEEGDLTNVADKYGQYVCFIVKIFLVVQPSQCKIKSLLSPGHL